jgi:hypothetical protein
MKTSRIAILAAFAALIFAGSLRGADWGDLEGKFVYDGMVPEAKKLDTSKDAACCGAFNVVDESLVVDKDGGIANILVYVITKDVAVHPEAASNIEKVVKLDNKGCRFEPHILPLWYTEQTLTITNNDNCGHNTNIAIPADLTINPLMPMGGELKDQKCKREARQPYPISCNIHPWMKAYIMPRKSPYFAVSGADGTFQLKNLPVGELQFKVWHERKGFLAAPGWEKGEFKMKIAKGANKLGKDGVVKFSPDLFTAPTAAGSSGGR